MKILKYPTTPSGRSESEIERRVQQLAVIAKAFAKEIESLQTELANTRRTSKQVDFDTDGIDFYREIQRYEIELIRNALHHCDGNQSQAARLLRMKYTTLNAKMKHYGLNPVRSMMLQAANMQNPK